MRYRITHRTDYRYASAVAQSNHLVHLGPRLTKGQTTEQHELLINPIPPNGGIFRIISAIRPCIW